MEPTLFHNVDHLISILIFQRHSNVQQCAQNKLCRYIIHGYSGTRFSSCDAGEEATAGRSYGYRVSSSGVSRIYRNLMEFQMFCLHL